MLFEISCFVLFCTSDRESNMLKTQKAQKREITNTSKVLLFVSCLLYQFPKQPLSIQSSNIVKMFQKMTAMTFGEMKKSFLEKKIFVLKFFRKVVLKKTITLLQETCGKNFFKLITILKVKI